MEGMVVMEAIRAMVADGGRLVAMVAMEAMMAIVVMVADVGDEG